MRAFNIEYKHKKHAKTRSGIHLILKFVQQTVMSSV